MRGTTMTADRPDGALSMRGMADHGTVLMAERRHRHRGRVAQRLVGVGRDPHRPDPDPGLGGARRPVRARRSSSSPSTTRTAGPGRASTRSRTPLTLTCAMTRAEADRYATAVRRRDEPRRRSPPSTPARSRRTTCTSHSGMRPRTPTSRSPTSRPEPLRRRRPARSPRSPRPTKAATPSAGLPAPGTPAATRPAARPTTPRPSRRGRAHPVPDYPDAHDPVDPGVWLDDLAGRTTAPAVRRPTRADRRCHVDGAARPAPRSGPCPT